MTRPGKIPLVRARIEPLIFRSRDGHPQSLDQPGAGIVQLVVHGLAVHGVAGSILLWGHFPVEGIFPLELTWVQTPFPPKLFHRTDSKDPDVHVLDG